MADQAVQFHDAGNRKFKNGEFENAKKCYQMALQGYGAGAAADEQRTKSYNNLALMHYKLQEWRECEGACGHVLDLGLGGSGEMKALLRRAMARKELKVGEGVRVRGCECEAGCGVWAAGYRLQDVWGGYGVSAVRPFALLPFVPY